MKPHILVVEDEAKLAHFIKLELEFEDYQVTVAPDGLSGLSLARKPARSNFARLDAAWYFRFRNLSSLAPNWK